MSKKLSGYLKTENVTAAGIFIFLAMIPSMFSLYQVLQYNTFIIMIILSLSLSLVWGYTGIFSFCQAVFFGVGAYTYAVLWKFTENLTLTPLFAVVSILAAAVVAFILGLFMFYGGINDVFVGLITLLVSLIVYKFMQTATGTGWQMNGKSGLFDLGGWTGMRQINRIQFGSQPLSMNGYFYFCLIIMFLVYLALRVMKVTKTGYGIMAIRENRERSELFGYNVPKIQTIIFVIGGAVAGLAGVLYVGLNGTICISNIEVTSSTMPLVIVATAGRKNPTAAVAFTIIYYLLSNYLASAGGQWTPIIMGGILIVVILFLANGLLVSVFNAVDALFSKILKRKMV